MISGDSLSINPKQTAATASAPPTSNQTKGKMVNFATDSRTCDVQPNANSNADCWSGLHNSSLSGVDISAQALDAFNAQLNGGMPGTTAAAPARAAAFSPDACANGNGNANLSLGLDAFQAQQQLQQSRLPSHNNFAMRSFESFAKASTNSGLSLTMSVFGGAAPGAGAGTAPRTPGLPTTNGLSGFNGINSTNNINGIHGWDGMNGMNGFGALNGLHGLNGLGGLNGLSGLNGLNGFNGLSGIGVIGGINSTSMSGINGISNDFQADLVDSNAPTINQRAPATSSTYQHAIDTQRTVSQPTSPAPSQMSASGSASASASVCASMPPSLSLPLSLTNEFIPQQQHQQQHQQQQQKLNRRTNCNRSYRHSHSQNHGSAQQEQRFGASNTQKWMGKYKELLHFVQQHGHSLVPLDYKANPSLAHWVKRQRCQYKAKVAGTHSTLTAERQQMLEDLTFCWDSHRAAWEERFRQLNGFKCQYGHCNVPSKYGENQSLAIWVKCQRRQYKLHRAGKKSNLNDERISKLSQMGFVWTPREVRSSHSPEAPALAL